MELKRIEVRLSPREYARLAVRANAVGISLAAYLRTGVGLPPLERGGARAGGGRPRKGMLDTATEQAQNEHEAVARRDTPTSMTRARGADECRPSLETASGTGAQRSKERTPIASAARAGITPHGG